MRPKLCILECTTGKNSIFRITNNRDPLPASVRWHKGRVVILGDAAHATLPYLGQGANQAIEDAAQLSKALADSRFSSVEQALVAYHEARHKKVGYLEKFSLLDR